LNLLAKNVVIAQKRVDMLVKNKTERKAEEEAREKEGSSEKAFMVEAKEEAEVRTKSRSPSSWSGSSTSRDSSETPEPQRQRDNRNKEKRIEQNDDEGNLGKGKQEINGAGTRECPFVSQHIICLIHTD
jgi:hypothetical protein